MARGALLVGAGVLVADDGLEGWPDEGERLDFGALEPLAALMQDTDADALLPKLRKASGAGTTLETLVAAAALANARSFGGTDYVGYHAAMALVPALLMSRQMPKGQEAIPVLKVIHRNTERIRRVGGRKKEALRTIQNPAEAVSAESLIGAERRGDLGTVERQFAAAMTRGRASAYELLQPLVRENIDVHQVVLAWRAWDLLRLTGPEHAHTMLRQVARHAVDRETSRRRDGKAAPSLRHVLPDLMSDLNLTDATPGTLRLDAKQLESLTTAIFGSGRDEAAEIMATALAKGTHPQDAGEALSLAAARLLLNDQGRTRGEAGKPAGSVHGASVGVHAADSAAAWRGIAAVSEPPIALATLIAGAWHTAGQSHRVGRQAFHVDAREDAAKVEARNLGPALAEAMREGDQKRAAAIGECWLSSGAPGDQAFALILAEMVAFDGALHHEKFFQTCYEGFTTSAPASQPLWIAAAARVAASGHGHASPAYQRALETE